MSNGGGRDSNKDCKLLQAAIVRISGEVETKYKWHVSQIVEYWMPSILNNWSKTLKIQQIKL